MLKRKILAAVLPVVAATTVVGAGFSAWYFGDFSGSNSSVNVGIDVTDTSDNVGELTTKIKTSTGLADFDAETNAPTLILDQGVGSDRIENSNIGISFLDGKKETIEALIFEYTIPEADLIKLCSAGLELEITASLELASPLSDYVELRKGSDGSLDNKAYFDGNNVTLDETLKYSKKISEWSEGDGACTATFAINLSKYDSNNANWNGLLKYKENVTTTTEESGETFTGKPKSVGQVNKMTEALEGKENLLKFEFNVSTTANQ